MDRKGPSCRIETRNRVVQVAIRIARDDTELGGATIARGDQVLVLLGAANHDPVRFADPDTLVLDRVGRGHLAFGHGTHFCLGAALARLEATEVFARLAGPLSRSEPQNWAYYTRGDSHTFRQLATLTLEPLPARPHGAGMGKVARVLGVEDRLERLK